MTDYNDLVNKIVAFLREDSLRNDVKGWAEALAYTGFSPEAIAKKLKTIDGAGLAMLCLVTVMRGTKIDTIIQHTADGVYLNRLKELKGRYQIVNTGGVMTRDTVTLSRITATFPLTTFTVASYMEAADLGIYNSVFSYFPWVGLSGVILIARANSSNQGVARLVQAHIVVSAAVTQRLTKKPNGEEPDINSCIERALKFSSIVNQSSVYDGKAYHYIPSNMIDSLMAVFNSDQFKALCSSLNININNVPSLALKPIDIPPEE